LPPGATIAPVILSSDKTHLSIFSGDKQAWPVYLSIGNIAKDIRRKPSRHATILIGYLPVTKLECFSKRNRQFEGYHLFHKCMRAIIAPLIQPGKDGVKMTCADRHQRVIFPILAAYIADHPEQCLISCCMENRCPRCIVGRLQLGCPVHSALRDHGATVRILEDQAAGLTPEEFITQGLRAVWPFWTDLPYCDIFSCITPDILHQLHKGLFKDHLVTWTSACIPGGDKEIDKRFKVMAHHPSLRHFKKGISMISQWTGTEYKNMEKVFLGIIAGAAQPALIRAVRGVLDFIYYAHFEQHSLSSLIQLEAALLLFHENKHVFVDQGIRASEGFNIPKLHAALHYVLSIRSRGTADGFNSEVSERLHIDCAKVAYNKTSKKGYIKQMTKWLSRQEKVERFTMYLQWAVPGYQPKPISIPEDHTSATADIVETVFGDVTVRVNQPATLEVPNKPCIEYHLPKKPSYPGTTLDSLITLAEFGAVDFWPCLETFLRHSKVPIPNIVDRRFSVYKRLDIWIPPLPQVAKYATKDTIFATRPQQAANFKPAKPGHFSTILAKKSTDSVVGENLDGTHSTFIYSCRC
jgi:Plavaka transposase